MSKLLHYWRQGGYGVRVTPSEPLTVGFPMPFARLVGPLFADNSEPTPQIRGMDGDWVTVSGGGLPAPIAARIDRADDGRFIVTGLVLGLGQDQEITWETLRGIRPASIIASIFDGFDDMNPYRDHDDLEISPAAELWQAHSQRFPDYYATARKARGSAATDLEKFASVYAKHRAATPHRAMSATAKELNVSRATAIRRAEQCRTAGLLPPKGPVK